MTDAKINKSDPPKKLKKKESIKSININFNNFSNIQIINKSPNSERISIHDTRTIFFENRFRYFEYRKFSCYFSKNRIYQI